MGYDRFAEIAAAGMSTEGKHLVVPQPPRLKKTELHSDKNCREAAFSLPPEMDTEEELEEEAERLKGVYRPFFEDCAPPLEERRKKMEIPEFLWRVATEEDFRNFAGVLAGEGKWKKVKIPHYGEPRGVAATYYRTVFCLDETFLAGESLWVCFRGVDYKAHVFLNGMYLGSHEGFFAPFEFEFTKTAEQGENVLCVMVENDYVHMGNSSEEGGPRYTGDKIYGATGPGYDDPDSGWHHCPPGMGVCQGVTVEARSSLFVRDVFVRPCADNDRENAQVWLELYGCRVGYRDVRVELSLYGQNFPETVFEKMIWEPATYRKVGVGDTLSESRAKAEGNLGERIPLRMERGLNELKIPVRIPDARLWEPKEPWLYQVQVRILAEDGSCVDTAKRQFGVRSFQIDTECTPKGRFLLNGRQIRLRGANSMGFGQQCVMRGDWNRLYTDLIYTKACHMNFIRLTQRPVQEEIYDFCDRMGILLQTDLPLFAMLRRSQFAEAVRQAQEMEHLIRSHPSAVLVTYINEPSPNADNKPHRGLTRPELESFFECANRAV